MIGFKIFISKDLQLGQIVDETENLELGFLQKKEYCINRDNIGSGGSKMCLVWYLKNAFSKDFAS